MHLRKSEVEKNSARLRSPEEEPRLSLSNVLATSVNVLGHGVAIVFVQVGRFSLPLVSLLLKLPFGPKKSLDEAKVLETHMRELSRSIRTKMVRRNIIQGSRAKQLYSLTDFLTSYRKTSETVFILGSGESLADIKNSQWQEIQQNDSIGFNFSLIHDFIPNYYFVEGVQPVDRYQAFLRNLERKASSYAKLPIIILFESWKHAQNSVEDLPESIGPNVYWSVPETIRTTKIEKIKSAIENWKNSVPQQQDPHLLAHGGSVGMILSACYLLGYKKIVLCGVDLVSSGFFWEQEEKYAELGPKNIQTGAVHATVDRTSIYRKHSIPMDEYILLFNELVLQPNGTTLYVQSEKSKLSASLPIFTIGESK